MKQRILWSAISLIALSVCIFTCTNTSSTHSASTSTEVPVDTTNPVVDTTIVDTVAVDTAK